MLNRPAQLLGNLPQIENRPPREIEAVKEVRLLRVFEHLELINIKVYVLLSYDLKKFEDVGEFIASVYVMNEMAFRINSEMFFGGLKFENLPTYYERLLKRESETNREMSEWLKTVRWGEIVALHNRYTKDSVVFSLSCACALDFLSSFLGDDCSPCLDIRLSKGEDYLFHWLMIDLWERRKEKYMAYFLSARLGVPNFS